MTHIVRRDPDEKTARQTGVIPVERHVGKGRWVTDKMATVAALMNEVVEAVAGDPMTPRIFIRDDNDANCILDALRLLNEHLIDSGEAKARVLAESGQDSTQVLQDMVTVTAYVTGLIQAIGNSTLPNIPSTTDTEGPDNA